MRACMCLYALRANLTQNVTVCRGANALQVQMCPRTGQEELVQPVVGRKAGVHLVEDVEILLIVVASYHTRFFQQVVQHAPLEEASRKEGHGESDSCQTEVRVELAWRQA